MSRMVSMAAVVPVRAGSRRLANKNLAPFAGTNLLTHKIRQLKMVEGLSAIYVSSDSEEMLTIAQEEGALPLTRPIEYADDVMGKPLGETIAYIASMIPTEHLLWAQCTSPLVDAQIYSRLLDTYNSQVLQGSNDSLITVNRLHSYLRNEQGPINYKSGAGHVPSQHLPPVWQLTYGAQIASTANMINWGYYYGPNPYLFELGKRESVDIDDLSDLIVARALLDTE